MTDAFMIYIFRHGQTEFNRDGKFTGWFDSKLTELGIKEAGMIAEQLKDKKFGIAFHTSLSRSKQTLFEILKFHPECTKVFQDDRMIERNYGTLNGMTHAAFIKKMGEKLYKLQVEGGLIHDLTTEGKREAEKFLGEQEYKVIHRGYTIPPPGGESFIMVETRVQSFINDLYAMIKKENTNVAISGHGNSIRLFRKIMEHASPAETVSWQIPFDSFYEYRVAL